MQRPPDSRLSPTALLALVVGLFSIVCFFFLTGVAGLAAIVLGVVAMSEIRRSEGRLHGDGVAIAAIALGTLHVGGVVLAIGLWVTSLAGARSSAPRPVAALPGPVAPLPAPTSAPVPINPEHPGGRSLDASPRETRFGAITLVDPDTSSGSFESLLRAELERARSERQTLLVFLSSPELAPCHGVGVALRDARVQKRLAGTRILRLNVADFYVELSRWGVPVDVLPGFALVSPEGRPADYVHGGEWDEDVPENILPVLTDFVHGRYVRRRHPWRGPLRGDETAL